MNLSKPLQLGTIALKTVRLKREGGGLSGELGSFLASTEGKAYVEAREKDAFERGKATGRKEGFADHEKEVMSLIQALQKTLEAFRGVEQEMIRGMEPQVRKLAVTVAEAVLERELVSGCVDIAKLLSPLLEQVPGITRLRIRLHPEDCARLQSMAASFRKNPVVDHIELIEDGAVSKGGCILDTNVGVIDATLETRTRSVKEILETP